MLLSFIFFQVSHWWYVKILSSLWRSLGKSSPNVTCCSRCDGCNRVTTSVIHRILPETIRNQRYKSYQKCISYIWYLMKEWLFWGGSFVLSPENSSFKYSHRAHGIYWSVDTWYQRISFSCAYPTFLWDWNSISEWSSDLTRIFNHRISIRRWAFKSE